MERSIERDDYYIPPTRLSNNSLNKSISHFVLLQNQYNKTKNSDYKRKLSVLAKQFRIKQIGSNKYTIHDNISNRNFVVNRVQYRNGRESNLLIGQLL